MASRPERSWGRGKEGWKWREADAQSNSPPSSLPVPQLWGGLRFTVPHLRDTKKTIQFDFQILR